MSLLVKAHRTGRDIVSVTPRSAGWHYVGFSAHRLGAGESMTLDTGADEICVVVLRGVASIAAQGRAWREIGHRTSVFADEAPYAVYVPAGEEVGVSAHTEAEIAIASAPGSRAHPARLIEPA